MMNTSTWQLETPIEAVIFDCDGTLSALEGIDELAKHNGVSEIVAALTAKAMGVTGINPDIYQHRLHLVSPKKEQVIALAEDYFKHQVPDVYDVIQLFSRLNKTIYIVSAGLNPAVSIFGERLRVPRERIFAVDLHFDSKGHYLDYDKTSLLTQANGKRDIVAQLKNRHQHIMHVGDGLNDYASYDLVTRFVGYGGIFYRENLKNRCEYYIHSPSLSPLLPLALTQQEYKQLTKDERQLYQKGMQLYIR